MSEWYIVQVVPNRERKVKKTLLGRQLPSNTEIEEILIPTESIAEFKEGEQQINEKRIWPGYLLIKMILSDESWAHVKQCDGVINFLGGKSPAPLSQEEVDKILEDLRLRQEQVVHKHDIELGDKVKINSGIFANCVGPVTALSHEKQKLNIVVNIFGRDTQVEDLDFSQVEVVQEENNG